MREIKFRAWDSKMMLSSDYGDWIGFDGVCFTQATFTYDTPNIEIQRAGNYILMQFTGLKDKNGKEIYEGDIVRFVDTEGKVFIKKVEWNETLLCYTFGLSYEQLSNSGFFQDAQLEIIGNIYESPELS